MNEPKDEHLDPLLNEAIGPDEPSQELLDRIGELTDGPMCDLLNRAIGPNSAACEEDELVQRILAATSDRPAVAGRIRPLGVAWRVAAMISIATSLAMIVWSLSQQSTVTPPPEVATIDEIESEWNDLTISDEAETTVFAQQIELISAGVDRIAQQQAWADSPDALIEDAAATVDWLDSSISETPAWF